MTFERVKQVITENEAKDPDYYRDPNEPKDKYTSNLYLSSPYGDSSLIWPELGYMTINEARSYMEAKAQYVAYPKEKIAAGTFGDPTRTITVFGAFILPPDTSPKRAAYYKKRIETLLDAGVEPQDIANSFGLKLK